MTEERPDDDQPTPPAAAKVVRTQELFGAEKEIVIDHEGERYRLRITRRGKLILQK
jgi:hemin uptake protein HemP